jgi:hypothetical protein
VLVQVLAGADPEEEAAGHELRARRGGVGDDRRMDPHRRAGDARAQAKALGRLRDAADLAPDEWALALRVDPGMKVVRDECELEAALLGTACQADELAPGPVLAGERIADRRHRRSLPRSPRR